MNTSPLHRILLVCLLLGATTSQAAERVGDFSLLDQIGNSHQVSWYDDHATIALLVQANGSEATLQALPGFMELQQQFQESVQFFMINPMGLLNRDAVNAQISAITSDIPVLMDDTQVISEALGVERSGEVFLFDPKSFRVVFRGPIGNGLDQAIAAVLNDEEIATPQITIENQAADVRYPIRSASISYEEEIAPILAENCATCHRDGGIAPFALDGSAMAQGWSPMIREVLMTKRMPPGQVDPHVHSFKNGRTLAIDETRKLIQWIESGSPIDGASDGSTDPLAQLNWPETKWVIGSEPDLIVKIPAQEVPATGVVDYVRIKVPVVGLAKDRWLRASEFIPGDRTVMHHATGTFQGGGLRGGNNVAVLNRYVPGSEPRLEPPNTGGLVTKDAVIDMTLHYTTSGREAVDESEFGLWFYPEDVVPEERLSAQMVGVFPGGWEDIPPHAKNFEMSNSFILPENANIYSYHPHMHFRGKDLRMFADYPDGTREELINIAKYSYAWQLTYELEEPIFMPKGTKITSIGHFDNSTQNLANPDPTRAIPWGEQSWDEMFFGEVIWKRAGE
jgi:mono/diheme cytochrome c family protein